MSSTPWKCKLSFLSTFWVAINLRNIFRFCETMESKLIPFVPALMEHFFAALNPAYPFHVKELALSAIGATGNLHPIG